jgi:hypothetical protein
MEGTEMKYYLDCEFDGPDLLSLALVASDGRELYLACHYRVANDPWVDTNVCPIIDLPDAMPEPMAGAQEKIEAFFRGDDGPHIIADWPTDFQHLLPLMHDGRGNMIDVPSFACSVVRVDAYPTTLHGAIKHNALWDARALMHKLSEPTQ